MSRGKAALVANGDNRALARQDLGNGFLRAPPFQESKGKRALLAQLRTTGAGRIGGSREELLHLLLGCWRALGDARDNDLLRKQDLAHPSLAENIFGRPVKTARARSPNEQFARNQISQGRVALRPIGSDRQVPRPRLIVEFGQRDFHPIDIGNDLTAWLGRVAGGQQQPGRPSQCGRNDFVPMVTTGQARDPDDMETVYDWVTVTIFAGLVTLYLSRSLDPRAEDDSLWHYLLPAIACGLANWLGNHGYGWAAVLLIAAALGYMFRFLRAPPPPKH